MNTIRWLPASRFRCAVVTFRCDPSLSILAEFPCPVVTLPLRRTYDWNALKQAARLLSYIRQGKVDIVHTYFASADLFGGVITKFAHSPCLISSRRDMGILRSAKHRFAYRMLHRMFDRVVAVSEAVRNVSIKLDGLDPAKAKTIYNSIDISRTQVTCSRSEVLGRYGLSESVRVVVSVGNLRRIKGFDVLIRTAASVCQECSTVRFLIAGNCDPSEPECRRELEALSRSLGVSENVKFLGPVEDVIPLLKASDVFCLLSQSEGFSNALLEAMACGLPCVATRVGGNSEAIQAEHDGYLVESGNSREAAARILQLLRNPAHALEIGRSAQASVVRRFSPETTTAQLIELYDEMLAERHKRL